jgi:ATP-binding cassette subfamily B protein
VWVYLIAMMPEKTKSDLQSNLFRYLYFIWRSGPRWSLASIVVVVVQGVLPLLTLFLVKMAVDSLQGALGADSISGFQSVTIFIVLLGVATLLEAVFSSVDRIISFAHGSVLTDRMYDVLHAKSTEVDLEYYESPQYHDTLHRAQQEAPVRHVRVLNNLRQLAQHSISVIAVGILLVWLHWVVGFVLLAAAVPAVFVRIRYAKKNYDWERHSTPAERQAAYLNGMLTKHAYAKEIRLFDLGSLFIDRFGRLRSQLRREKVRIATKKTLAELLTMSAAICVSFCLLGYLGLRAVQGLMSLGDLVMFYAAVQRGQALLRQVFNGVADLYEDNLFLGNLYTFLELKPKLQEPFKPIVLRKPFRSGIVFDHVSFQYPGESHRVLEDIVLTIRPGEHVALVGENGAGKTTLAKLLCRLYDPTGGAITLDGVDLRHYATQDLRRSISVVFQDYPRYQLTARENIWLGNINVPPDSQHLEPAVRKAGVHPLIEQLDDGYDTVLGNSFDGGHELSAGEWQKIALARAFLHDGEIIVLDEPSSSLDAEAEYEIFERFHQLVKGKMAILISHRLSTVKMADRIYVLKHGRIAEFGTHQELMRESRIYARMYEAQAQRYR